MTRSVFRTVLFVATLAIAPACGLGLRAQAAGKAGNTTEALRLLKANCFSCHNEEKKKGDLVMTTREGLLEGGENGAALVAGKPDQTRLLTALAEDADPHMPPKKQLAPAQIEVLRRWVKEGAKWDTTALVDEPPKPRAVALAALPAAYHPVLALALSPDATKLAVGCGNQVALYDVANANLALIARVAAHPDAVQSLAWSADGHQLASGAFRRIVLWNPGSLAPLRQITSGLTDRIAALRFTPDRKQLVASDGFVAQSGIVRLVEPDSGKVAASWPAHADTIPSLALSADGKLLATAGADKLVKLWDLKTKREIARLEGHSAPVLTLAFNSNNATQLVSGGADRLLKVWDVKTREGIISLGKHTEAVSAVAWSPGRGAVFAVTDTGRLFRYTDLKSHGGGESSESAKERKLDSAETVLHCLAATPDGGRIFAGTADGRLMVWNQDGKLVTKLDVSEASPGAHPAPALAVAQPPPAVSVPQAPSPAPTLDRRGRLPDRQQARAPVPLFTSGALRGGAATTIATAKAPVSFVRDVLPVLSRAGCNAGACHAKPDGQNGFRLSIFSFNPKADYDGIVTDARGRRIFPSAPEESLLLLKPTLGVPHEGGERFGRNSEAYRIIAAWIRGGMIYRAENEPELQSLAVTPHERRYRKGAAQQLRVEAHYSDGSVRDVTGLASFTSNDKELARVTDDGRVSIGKVSGQAVIVVRYMGLVGDAQITVPADRLLPDRQYTALPVNNFIDQLAYAQFKQLGLFPSAGCTDEEFLRRASLDTLGLLPTPEEARAFLADSDPQKRERLIGRLLEHPAYADYWANKWADLLRPNPDRAGIKSVFLLDQWLRESFRANKPYDQFVREIVTCEGNTHRYGPAVVYRDKREPADLATTFSQLFLGVRLECAKCHHHPNEKWGQDDFYRLAAFFGPLKQKGAGISAPISAGNETFYFNPGKTVKHPVTGDVMEPRPPDGPEMKLPEDTDPRRALADWMTGARNPFFARAIANRVWAAFFGRGIVEPVDDFRLSNPPSNPALLDALAQELVKQQFNLKALMRTILASHLYQLSATPNEFNRADTRNFSRAYRRRLPAEVLADAMADVTGVPDKFDGLPPGSRAMQAWTYKIDSQIMDAFGRPNPSTEAPCERDARPSVVQALHLSNSKRLQEKLAAEKGRVARLVEGRLAPGEIINELYLVCYSRLPTAAELKAAMVAFETKGATRRTGTEDVLWALLNSAEFVFNH